MLKVHKLCAYETFRGEVDVDYEGEPRDSLDDAISDAIFRLFNTGLDLVRFFSHYAAYQTAIEVEGIDIIFTSEWERAGSISDTVIESHPTYAYLVKDKEEKRLAKEEKDKEEMRRQRFKSYQEMKKEFEQ